MSEANLNLSDPNMVLSLFGPQDQFLRMIRNHYGVAITHRDGKLKIIGEEEPVRQATSAIESLQNRARQGKLCLEDVQSALGISATAGVAMSSDSEVNLAHQHRKIKPRTEGQAFYVSQIRQSDLTLCRGPAGCGKTYLAVALAVEALKSRAIRKIVLVRPAVEAGESLGFLPGDLQAKLNPYLRPLLDGLNEMLDYDQVKYLMEHDVIEVIPLAYMRGRTLNDAFIILDEAQNTTSAQMKMFLTRMGANAKFIINGDMTQIDLPRHQTSGLAQAVRLLKNTNGIEIIELTTVDVIRHRLVKAIIEKYEGDAIKK